MTGSILKEAEELVNGPRAADYGPVAVNWSRTVTIFEAMTGISLTAEQGLMFMVAVKLAREAQKHKRDNLTDAAAYLELASKIMEGRE